MSVYDIDTVSLSEAGAWCGLRHPATRQPLSRDGKPLRVRLAGPDSVRFRTARRLARDGVLERLAAARERQDDDAVTALEVESEIEMAAVLTLDWENIAAADGTPLACSLAAARRLYRDLPWLRAQVAGFAAARANFTKASGSG